MAGFPHSTGNAVFQGINLFETRFAQVFCRFAGCCAIGANHDDRLSLVFFQLTVATAFELTRRQIDGVGNMASAEVVPAAGINYHSIFFVYQQGSFTASDLLNLGKTALEGHNDHGNQQYNPSETKYGVPANKLHNLLQHGV